MRGGLLRLTTVAATRSFTSIPNTLSSRLPVARMLGATTTSLLTQMRGMKVRASVKKLCDGCMVRQTSPILLESSVARFPAAAVISYPHYHSH
jgi:hypothetical protein